MNIIKGNSTNIVVFGSEEAIEQRDGSFYSDIWRLQYSPNEYSCVEGVESPEHFVANSMTYVNGVWTVVDQEAYDAGVKVLAEQDAVPVRAERDKRLQNSDWTQVGDMPDSFKQVWATYRQQLRDMSNDPKWPWVEFPKEPSQKSPTQPTTDLPTV